jgi:hypothetical protein
MGFIASKFTYCQQQKTDCTFSLKSAAVFSADTIVLPDYKLPAGICFSLSAGSESAWRVVAPYRENTLQVTVASALLLFYTPQVVRHASMFDRVNNGMQKTAPRRFNCCGIRSVMLRL